MPFKLSPSSLSLFCECNRCFWLSQHKIWSRPSAGFPTLPAGMDRILKNHFDCFRDRNLLPPELCNNSHCEELCLFGVTPEEKELLSVWRNNFKGLRWSDENGNVFHGAIDHLLKSGNKLVVLDFKTRGFPPKENSHESYQNQLDAYCFLLQRNGFETENHAFLLYYIPNKVLETGEVVFDTHLVRVKVRPEKAEELFRRAIECLEGGCPQEKCKWCGKV
jgi:hypothetical protein